MPANANLILTMLVSCMGLLAAETGPEHFRITPKGGGMITREFIASIRICELVRMRIVRMMYARHWPEGCGK